MNLIKTLTRYALYTLLCVVFLTSCNQKNNEPKFYTWQTSLEIRYSDNTKDTIFNSIKISVNDELKYKLKASEPTFFGAEKIVPCLVMKTHWKEEILACEVKTFKILTQNKLP